MELNKKQSKILSYILSTAKLKPEADIAKYDFDNNFSYRAATSSFVNKDDLIYGVFTLPKENDHVFICVTNGDPFQIGGVLCGLENYLDTKEMLCIGDTVPIVNDYINNAGWKSALLLRVPTILEEFPDSHKFENGYKVYFYLVIFIDSEELEIKKNHGLDALMEVFENNNRDIITFAQKGG